MFSSLMAACGVIVSVYTLLIIVRVLSSWFAGPGWRSGAIFRIMRVLGRITDPYLAFFRRFKLFHLGPFDFSPVVGLIVLSVIGNIFLSLSAYQALTLGLVLALFLARLWAAAAFFLNMYILLILARLVAYFARVNPASSFLRYLDMILLPVLDPIARFLFRGRGVHYLPLGHIVGGLFLLSVRIFGALLIDKMVILLGRLPF